MLGDSEVFDPRDETDFSRTGGLASRPPRKDRAARTGSLAGCASGHHHHGRSFYDSNVNRNPVVTIESGRIVVYPAVLVFLPQEKDFDIVWQLPKDGKFRFQEKGGIEIEGELLDKVVRVPDGASSIGVKAGERLALLDKDQREIVDCKASEGGFRYTCRNLHTRPGIFKYTIRVNDGGSTKLERDPPVANW